jgi:serine/threonine protein kinase
MLSDHDTINLDTRYFSDISLQSTQPATAPCDVTTFLASLQEWKVDILPITWQAAQQPIGAGATSRIDEVSQTVHRSFVFKRLSDKHKEPAMKESSLRMILNEIAILSHTRVREHPNVIELEGICWDVESESQVWPVLVFDRTNWGDLSDFVDKPEWKTLTATLRMNICSDIGRAMSFMHDQRKLSCSHKRILQVTLTRVGIIHGDIKPENVLIYKDGTGVFTGRLTDFGYSSQFTDADEYIFMPKSWPWYAPEHHHRGFRPENARNMDMFSFGVLSLWVMYRPYLSGTSLLPAELLWTSQYITSRTKDVDRWTLDELKKRDELVKFAQQLVSDDTGLEDSAKYELRVFFGTVLQCNPDIRRTELQSGR